MQAIRHSQHTGLNEKVTTLKSRHFKVNSTFDAPLANNPLKSITVRHDHDLATQNVVSTPSVDDLPKWSQDMLLPKEQFIAFVKAGGKMSSASQLALISEDNVRDHMTPLMQVSPGDKIQTLKDLPGRQRVWGQPYPIEVPSGTVLRAIASESNNQEDYYFALDDKERTRNTVIMDDMLILSLRERPVYDPTLFRLLDSTEI